VDIASSGEQKGGRIVWKIRLLPYLSEKLVGNCGIVSRVSLSKRWLLDS
jgi:hypothetical protein